MISVPGHAFELRNVGLEFLLTGSNSGQSNLDRRHRLARSDN
jgi:hypothetical protein